MDEFAGNPVFSRSVLLVDDDAFVRTTIAEMLEGQGYTVLQAETGNAAIATAMRTHIDAFLLDMEMPGMSGAELCRIIRAMDAYKVTPILFVTGAVEHTNLVEAFAAGCDDFINKPFDAVVLRARLGGNLARLHYFEQLRHTREALNQYLSKRTREVVEAASRCGTAPPPELRAVTILFTDIRGFTALAEEMKPEKVFSLLSVQLAEQVNLVYEHSGYIDKFGGDGVMAVFDGKDMVRQACLCALRIIECARAGDVRGNEKIRQLGIGIHAGQAMIGNIGSPQHLDYSVIGTTVNLAARLCGHAGRMSIVVSKAVRDAAGDDQQFHFHDERPVAVRGLKEPVVVYTLSHPSAG